MRVLENFNPNLKRLLWNGFGKSQCKPDLQTYIIFQKLSLAYRFKVFFQTASICTGALQSYQNHFPICNKMLLLTHVMEAWRHTNVLKHCLQDNQAIFTRITYSRYLNFLFQINSLYSVVPSFSKNILMNPLIHRAFRVQSLSNLHILPRWGNFHIYVYINGKCICESDNGIQALILMPPAKILPQGEGNYTCPGQSFFKRSIFPQQKRGGRGSKVIGNYEIPY